MDITPNPQWIWKICRDSDFIRCRLTQKSDGYELEAWKNTFFLFDKTVAVTWADVQAQSDAWRAAYLLDGWQLCE